MLTIFSERAIMSVNMADLTSEQIMAKCPPEIPSSSIKLTKIGGYHRQKNPHHAGRAVAKMRKSGSTYYKEEFRIKAACVYAMTGSAAKTGEILGIKPGTIRQWKLQPWWQQVIDRIRNEKDDELDVKLTHIMDKSLEVINDRLENGDFVYDVKKGELVRKPMGGKETAVVTSIMVDKRAMIREKRVVRRQETEVMDRLKNLASEFEKMTKHHKAKDITDVSSVIKSDDEVVINNSEVVIENAEERDTVQESNAELSSS